MEFLEEIKSYFKGKLSFDNQKYKVYLFGESGCVVFGANDIYSFQTQEIVIRLKKQKLCINGEKLNVENFSKGQIVISGKITKMEII